MHMERSLTGSRQGSCRTAAASPWLIRQPKAWTQTRARARQCRAAQVAEHHHHSPAWLQMKRLAKPLHSRRARTLSWQLLPE